MDLSRAVDTIAQRCIQSPSSAYNHPAVHIITLQGSGCFFCVLDGQWVKGQSDYLSMTPFISPLFSSGVTRTTRCWWELGSIIEVCLCWGGGQRRHISPRDSPVRCPPQPRLPPPPPLPPHPQAYSSHTGPGSPYPQGTLRHRTWVLTCLMTHNTSLQEDSQLTPTPAFPLVS